MKAGCERQGQASDYEGNRSLSATTARVPRSAAAPARTPQRRKRASTVPPSAMSAKERMAELGAIFARGFRRSLNCLDDLGEAEPSCG